MDRTEIIKMLDNLAGSSWYMPLYYRFLKLLAEWWKPALSVELGVCSGEGSLNLCQGYPGGIVIGVDTDNVISVDMSAIKNFVFMQMDSILAANEYAKLVGEIPVNILFIDTIHTYERAIAEYNAWFPHLARPAIIAIDDLRRPGMIQAYSEIPGHHMQRDFLHNSPDAHDGGFGIILT